MDIKILKETKDEFEFEIASVTLAELLKVYLNKDSSVEFAAWKRVHPTENPIVLVKSSNPKKSVNSAIAAISKDLGQFESDFSKLK